MALLVIGGRKRERIAIDVLRRLYPKAEDYSDGNWVDAQIDVSVGVWRGTYHASLHVDEFIDFRKQLETMHATLQGVARFDPMEPWLELTVTAESSGLLSVTGTACHNFSSGTRLEFELESMDQSHIPAMLSQLRDIEREIPLRGSPED